jgi:type IV secretion system protein VirD4
MPEILRWPVKPKDGVPWLEGTFVGWQETDGRLRTMLLASKEDSVAVLGPPRVGKTSGVLVPSAMTWPGALISASTKPDVLRATRGRRLSRALHGGGDVYAYAPTERRDHIGGARCIRWSPTSGCEDPATCELRVLKLLGPEKPEEDKFFRNAGATVMRGFFHAAALSHCGVRRMKGWIDALNVDEAIDILDDYADSAPSARDYASGLKGIAKQPPETKAGTFGTVSERLAGIVGNAAVLDNADAGDFDIEAFLRSASTLYIVSPEDTMTVIAPLVALLVESIVSVAYRLAAERPDGRLDPPLLLLLDEVGAIAPLPSLPQIMSQGASQGVLCVWAAQSFNQLRARWGEEWARSIWGASSQKIIFGSLSDHDLLEQISQLFGEYDRRVAAHGDRTSAMLAVLANQNTPPHLMRSRNVEILQLHGQAPGMANLVAMTPAGPAVTLVSAPPAYRVEPFASCQQEEAASQARLASGEVTGPDQLRSEEGQRLMVDHIGPEEYQRFKAEQSHLSQRLTELVNAAPAAAEEMRLRDRGLAIEERHMRHLLDQTVGTQAEMRYEILHRFATGGMPHFTYVLGELPEDEAAPASPPTAKRRLRREPDVYGGPATPRETY